MFYVCHLNLYLYTRNNADTHIFYGFSVKLSIKQKYFVMYSSADWKNTHKKIVNLPVNWFLFGSSKVLPIAMGIKIGSFNFEDFLIVSFKNIFTDSN